MAADVDLWLRLEQPKATEECPDPSERFLYVDKNKSGTDHFYRRLSYDKQNAIFRRIP